MENWERNIPCACAASPADDYAADDASAFEVSAAGASVLDISSTAIYPAVGAFSVRVNSMGTSAVGALSTMGASVIGA